MDVVGGQRILDALRVDTPARLDRDIFRAVHFIGDRHSHDAGVGLLHSEQLVALGIEGAEHAVPPARTNSLAVTVTDRTAATSARCDQTFFPVEGSHRPSTGN